MTLTHIAERLAVELLLPVTTCLNDLRLLRLGFEHPTFHMRGKLYNRLRYRRGFTFELRGPTKIILVLGVIILCVASLGYVTRILLTLS